MCCDGHHKSVKVGGFLSKGHHSESTRLLTERTPDEGVGLAPREIRFHVNVD